MEIKFDKFEEQIFLNTVLVENLTDKESGTGFVMVKPLKVDGVDKHKVLLFSNKHVFWGKKDKDAAGISKNIRLTFHKKEADDTYKLGQTHSFEGTISRKSEKGYFDHPNQAVDVACANISNLNERGVKLNLPALSIEDFLTFERSELIAGMKILFVGYPSGFYDKKNFLPVMRSGTIASIPSVDFNGEPRILLDAQVFPGSSGSPVFASINGRYKLLGIVSDAIFRGLNFIEVEKSTDTKVEKISLPTEFMGLGLLFTSETIREVYNLA
jgi:hypothetical protein